MSYGEDLALGETMHHEYDDGEPHLHPPSRRHVIDHPEWAGAIWP